MERIYSELTDINWNKIFLNLKVKIAGGEEKDGLSFFLINRMHVAVTEFEVISRSGDVYDISLNISNSGVNRCVDNGVYRLLITDDTEVYSLAEYHGKISFLLDKSQCLRVDSQKHAYTATFFIPEDEETPVINLQFQYMKNVGMSYIPPLDAEGAPTNDTGIAVRLKKIPARFNSFSKKVRRKSSEWLYRFSNKHFFKESGKKILFMSDMSDTLSDSLKCLYDRLSERGLDKEYDISFVLINKSLPVGKLKALKRDVRKFFLLGQTNILIIDDAISVLQWLILDKRQTVIQVWHSGAGFKTIGYARWGARNAPSAFCYHRQNSYFISDSEMLAPEWALLSGILNEQVIPTGMPRIDKYLSKEHRETTESALYEAYPAAKSRKVLLFAPTYRGVNQKSAYYPYDKIDFEALYRFCRENDWCVLFKLHPYVTEPVPITDNQKDLFFDVTSYGSINDLFYITDLLITDYSSAVYEYSLMHKPMLAYAFDDLQYFSSHGLARPYDENLPGKLCRTFDEIMDSLKDGDFQFEKNAAFVKKFFDYTDGANCDRVIDWLILGNLPGKYADRLKNRLERIESVRGRSYAALFEEKAEDAPMD